MNEVRLLDTKMYANVNNYITAAVNSARNQAQTVSGLRRNAVDFGQIAKSEVAAKGLEKEAAIRAATNVGKAQINAKGRIDIAKSDVKTAEAKRRAKNQQVMTGKLAAAGSLLAQSFDEGPKQIAPKTYDWQKTIDRNEAKITEAQANLKKWTDKTTNPTSPASAAQPGALADTPGDQPNVQPPAQGEGWSRLSKLISKGEGTSGPDGYNTMFTGSKFSGFGAHPRQLNSGGGYKSDAAGKYQFLSSTWDGAKNALNLPDFSPASQEKAGRYLAQQRGVDPDAIYQTPEELLKAVDKLSPEWASLPTIKTGTSYYGQGGLTPQQIVDTYFGN